MLKVIVCQYFSFVMKKVTAKGKKNNKEKY